MKYLKQVVKELQTQYEKHKNEHYNYAVPKLWDSVNIKGISTYNKAKIVNPYEFYFKNVKKLSARDKSENYLQSLSLIQNKRSNHGEWIKKSFTYSTMIRTSAAYDHDRDGYITQNNLYGLKESGTFLKFMLLIPYLKSMGIDTLYLLPFFKPSTFNKKGEFSSCYAVSDFFSIDETLADPLLKMSVEDQCKAFMELCHMHDLRVIIDIIPRTNAIRSNLLQEHPDWFYWIYKKEASNFKPPHIETVEKLAVADNATMKEVYIHEKCKTFLKKFTWDPKTIDAKKYKKIVKECTTKNEDLLSKIEEEFNITIACAFSDQVNDPQPVWSDVTFLRMYLDHPTLAKNFIDEKQPPYILFDVAKSNLHPGEKENRELWDVIGNIIPFYQQNYGIDGVRIDMGHALPIALVDEIIKKAKAIDPDICIIAEELDVRNDKISKEKGYNMILGNGFSEECRIDSHRLHDFYYGARELALPLFAMCENHDSPRSSAREGKKTLCDMLTILNLFTPNGVAFMNSGQEFYEVQPMNLGLDSSEIERYRLDKKDFRYAKLALFDSFSFTYDESRLIDLLQDAMKIRKKYMNEIIDLKKSIPAWFKSPWDLGLGSFFCKKDRCILVVANANLEDEAVYEVQLNNVIHDLKFYPRSCKEVFSTHCVGETSFMEARHHIYLKMKPGEVKVIEIK